MMVEVEVEVDGEVVVVGIRQFGGRGPSRVRVAGSQPRK